MRTLLIALVYVASQKAIAKQLEAAIGKGTDYMVMMVEFPMVDDPLVLSNTVGTLMKPYNFAFCLVSSEEYEMRPVVRCARAIALQKPFGMLIERQAFCRWQDAQGQTMAARPNVSLTFLAGKPHLFSDANATLSGKIEYLPEGFDWSSERLEYIGNSVRKAALSSRRLTC